jgi:hypothetical protein
VPSRFGGGDLGLGVVVGCLGLSLSTPFLSVFFHVLHAPPIKEFVPEFRHPMVK